MKSAQQAFDEAKPGEDVLGWKLDRAQRPELLARFAPKYPQAIADHVTLKSKVGKTSSLPPETGGTIIGRADDGSGVEAMVVRIGASTDRPDGGTYHITWSLAEGRDAKESNGVIAARGWQPVDPPIEVRLQPQVWQKEKS
jgi:hypothetical protein